MTTDLFYIRTRRKLKRRKNKLWQKHVLADIAGISIEGVVGVSPFPLLQDYLLVTKEKAKRK